MSESIDVTLATDQMPTNLEKNLVLPPEEKAAESLAVTSRDLLNEIVEIELPETTVHTYDTALDESLAKTLFGPNGDTGPLLRIQDALDNPLYRNLPNYQEYRQRVLQSEIVRIGHATRAILGGASSTAARPFTQSGNFDVPEAVLQEFTSQVTNSRIDNLAAQILKDHVSIYNLSLSPQDFVPLLANICGKRVEGFYPPPALPVS